MTSDLVARRLMKTTQDSNGEVKVANLKLDCIRLDTGTQTRARIDETTVAEYAEAMKRGDKFPPVVVFESDGEFILADGFHRVKAARKARLKSILSEIRIGSRQDALKFALEANHRHGLRRTNADKRKAVELALTEFGNLSDHLVSEMCGVSVPTVGTIRDQLLKFNSSSRRLGKDGKLRTLPISGRNGAVRFEDDGDDAPPNDTANHAFLEVADALASLEALVERVVQEHPEKRAAVLAAISKARSDLLQLEKRVAAAEHGQRSTAR